MSLVDVLNERYQILGKETANEAAEVIPGFFSKGRDAPTYRQHLLKSYHQHAGEPRKRDGNGQFRTADESRLDRAWNDVSETVDRSESDIRACVLDVYDDAGEFENKPARLRHDFNIILDRTEIDTDSSS